MRVGCSKGLGAALDKFDIGYPVTLPSCEPTLVSFAIEACWRKTKERLIDTFERIDADHCVEMAVDPAGDNRHYPAPGADVEFCGSGAESILGDEGGSLTTTSRAPIGVEVHTPPCLTQNEQVQARAGISAGSGSQMREKQIFPQWHLPWINMRAISAIAEPISQVHPTLRRRAANTGRWKATPC